MIRASKEYWSEVVIPAFRWMKKHWKGYLGIVVVIYAGTVGWLLRDELIDGIKSKFSRKEES